MKAGSTGRHHAEMVRSLVWHRQGLRPAGFVHSWSLGSYAVSKCYVAVTGTPVPRRGGGP